MIFDYTDSRREKVDNICKVDFLPLPISHYLLGPCSDDFFGVEKVLMQSKCRFCSHDLKLPTHQIQDSECGFSNTLQGYICENCGWWVIKSTYSVFIGGGEKLDSSTYEFGILKKYAIDSLDLPIKTLRDFLGKKPNQIYNINHKKMELLVKDVFEDFFETEVIHVGGSGDGGIDLLLIRGDSEFIVQVKRRQTAGKVETVQVIRELVGAMLLNQTRNAIFVSTSNHFSKGAIEASKRAEKLNIVEKIELYDFNKFIDILKLTNNELTLPWEWRWKSFIDNSVDYKSYSDDKLKTWK